MDGDPDLRIHLLLRTPPDRPASALIVLLPDSTTRMYVRNSSAWAAACKHVSL